MLLHRDISQILRTAANSWQFHFKVYDPSHPRMKKAAAKTPPIDTREFYAAFIAAAERELGPQEKFVIHAIIGFECGGPTDLLVFPKAPGLKKGTLFYVTTDLIYREDQPANSLGRYELAMASEEKDLAWTSNILTRLAFATLDEVFDENHTIDITAWVEPECQIKGLLLTKLFTGQIKHQSFGALFCFGLTKIELDFALENGSDKLLAQMKAENIFPITDPKRASVSLK
jgi:hypothetical protein